MIHSDLLEVLPVFPYSELLIWMLPAPNVTDHSYFDSAYLQIFKYSKMGPYLSDTKISSTEVTLIFVPRR